MNKKMEKLIEEVRARHFQNKRALWRMDQKQSLVYGLCKENGIDASNMNPKEAWEALEKKTGVSAEEYQNKAGGKETDYQDKIIKDGDLEKKKEGSYLIYKDGIYMKMKNGEFSHISSGKTLRNAVGERATFLDDNLEDSVIGGKEFNKHKLSQNELDKLGDQDRVIYNNVPYLYYPDRGVLEDPNMKTLKVGDVLGKDVRIYKSGNKGVKKKIRININGAEKKEKSGKVEFSDDSYTEDKVEKARKEYESRTDEEADKIFRGYSGAVWKTLDTKQRMLVKDYSTKSDHFNALSRGIRYKDRDFDDDLDEDYDESYKDTNALAEVIDKCEIPQDTVLFRGIDYNGLSGLLGQDAKKLLAGDPDSLVGLVGRDPAFMSTAVNNRKNLSDDQKTKFDNVPIRMEIYTPKGTKGMYIQPVSKYGDKQNGYRGKLSDNRYEMEMLLQRGTGIKITKVIKDTDKWGKPIYTLQCEVIGQEYEPVGNPTGNEKIVYKRGH